MNKTSTAFRNIFTAIITMIFVTLTSPAQALSFDFSFTDGVDTVSGTVFGLIDNDTSAATSLIASGGALGSSPIEFVLNLAFSPVFNEFEVLNGGIVSFEFLKGIDQSPLFIGLSLFDDILSTNSAFTSLSGVVTQTFANNFPVFTPSTVSTVPLPPAGVLFITGLIGLGCLRRRAKIRAQA